MEIDELKKKISIEEKLSEKKGIIPMSRDKDNVFLEHLNWMIKASYPETS